jgi:hypothetical protein
MASGCFTEPAENWGGQIAHARLKRGFEKTIRAGVSKVSLHCYGCPAALSVDDDLPEEALRIARWTNSRGQTFCPGCARRRGLEDPWGTEVPWDDYDDRPRDTRDDVAARDPAPLGSALEGPLTRSALKRYGRRAWAWLLAGGATLLAATVFLGVKSSDAKELLRTGRHTTGVVYSYGSLREGGEITVRYLAEGELREGSIHVSEAFVPVERVEVIYDRSDPSHIRTPQDANESPLATRVVIYAIVFGLIMFGAGIVVLWRPRGWRRLLRTPWKAYAATYIPGRARRSGPGVRLVARDASRGEETALRLGGTMRSRAAKLANEPLLWAAGDLNGRVWPDPLDSVRLV